jgi:hypothetical protein
MDKNKIIYSLKRDKRFNPFNQNFDFEYITEKVKKNIKNNEISKEDVSTILATPILNAYFKDYYLAFKNTIKEINIDYENFIMLVYSITNRDFLLLQKRIENHFRDLKEFHILDIYRLKIETLSGEKSDVVGFAERSIDLMNLILNFSKYYEETWFDESSTVVNKSLDSIINFVFLSSNLYESVKDGYDIAIWENGYVELKDSSKKVFFRYKDKDYPLFFRIGLNRLHENSSAVSLAFHEEINNRSELSTILRKSLRQYRKRKRISRTRIKDGYLKYSLKKGEDEDVYGIYTEVDASICIFYPFIIREDLPNLTNLSVQKIFVMLSEVIHLFRKAVRDCDPEVGESNYSHLSWENLLKRYSFCLKEEDLRKYLLSKTIFNNTQISEFINLLEHTEGRYNLWKKPLIKNKDSFFIPLFAISYPQTAYLVDEWLDQGGYSLERRGFLLEEYIKKTLRDSFLCKGLNFTIPEQKQFENPNREKEEIDLILITDYTILFAEIKCIKLPTEARNRHDTLEKLQKGAKQINRKVDFIYKYSNHFEQTLGMPIKNKKVVKAVITNYPIFSGIKFFGVPIIDFYLLEGYINTGKLVLNKNFSESSKTLEKTIRYYLSKDEISKNLHDYIHRPPAIYSKLPEVEIRDFKVKIDGLRHEFYREISDMKDSIYI